MSTQIVLGQWFSSGYCKILIIHSLTLCHTYTLMPEFYNNTNITNQIKFIGRADLSTTSRAMVLAYKVQRGQMVSTQ